MPLYLQIVERLRADVLDSPEFRDGMRLPSERDLQARYGVSRPTISKALAALAAEGLLTKSQGRGSFLLTPSSPYPAISSRLIGFVAPVNGEELVQRIHRGIHSACARRGYRVLLGSSAQYSLVHEREAVGDFLAMGARGVILYPFARARSELAEDYLCTERFEAPLVLLDTCRPDHGHTQVVFDNRRAGYAMMSHLLARGHRRIAVVLWSEHFVHPALEERLQGFQAALRKAGLALDPSLVYRFQPLGDETSISETVDRILALREPPTAIIAADDIAALEIVDLLQGRGVRVPDEIRVAGFDNRVAARRFRPALTTTSPDFEHMGELAAELLIDQIESGSALHRTYVLDVPLVHTRTAETAKPRRHEFAVTSGIS